MRDSFYEEIADLHKARENKIKNAFLSFLCGGVLGLLGEGIVEILVSFFSLSREDGLVWMLILFIFLASFLTSLGIFDRMVTIFRCGLLIPITGFAHSMTSCCLDTKTEGLIYGMGSNAFKLAGTVLFYGVSSAFLLGAVRYLIEVIA